MRKSPRIGLLLTITWLLLGGAPLPAQEGGGRLFGTQERNEEALIGILYDFKMDQKRQAVSMDPSKYVHVLNAFLGSGWDESVLNKYFRATNPVYATQIFIPLSGADAAPKAFGMEKIVKPRLLVVHYKGQVLPPRAGTFRLVGYADDILCAAINGKTCLIGGRMQFPMGEGNANWAPSEHPKGGMKAANGNLFYGDWIELKTDKPVDLDVLVGERPGGQFCAFLMYQERGVNYEMDGGYPVLPVFQLAKSAIPDGGVPPHTPPGETWKAVP
jgi:hypothetical protein